MFLWRFRPRVPVFDGITVAAQPERCSRHERLKGYGSHRAVSWRPARDNVVMPLQGVVVPIGAIPAWTMPGSFCRR